MKILYSFVDNDIFLYEVDVYYVVFSTASLFFFALIKHIANIIIYETVNQEEKQADGKWSLFSFFYFIMFSCLSCIIIFECRCLSFEIYITKKSISFFNWSGIVITSRIPSEENINWLLDSSIKSPLFKLYTPLSFA